MPGGDPPAAIAALEAAGLAAAGSLGAIAFSGQQDVALFPLGRRLGPVLMAAAAAPLMDCQ